MCMWLIQVSKQCHSVYVDGSETSGGDGVTVTVRYGRHEAVVSLLVWYPELPLSVEVSDDRLNLIKGWRVPPKRSVHLIYHSIICSLSSVISILYTVIIQ